MQTHVRPLDSFGTLIIFGLCASWGLNQVAAKVALADIPPLTQAAWRSAGATLVLGAIGIWREPTLFARDRTLIAGILCGICFALEFVALYIGLQYTSATHAVLFLYTAPFFVALGLPLITPSERLTTLQWAGLALSFLLITYGIFGVFANLALFVHIAFIFAALVLLGATLTLPGIAGIVLTIGMAVDSNVLIYERIREEAHMGRSIISALDAGFKRAFATIVDSNVTMFVAAAILYFLGSGPVRGFAVSLALGILTTIITAVTMTRMMIAVWYRYARPTRLPI